MKNLTPTRIDVHAHALISKEMAISRADGTVLHDYEQLCKLYDDIGITMGIIMPIVSPEFQTFLITSEDAWFMSRNSSNKLSWCCNVDPRMECVSSKTDFSRLLQYYKKHGAVGVGEITTNCSLDDPAMDNLLYHCAQCDLPVTIHWATPDKTGYGVYGGENLVLLEKTLKKYPKLTIIGHSVPFWEQIYEKNGMRRLEQLMREFPNLYCDTSANSGYNAASKNTPYFYEFLDEFQDRVLFGLDVCYVGERLYEKTIQFYDDAVSKNYISEETYNKINYLNAVKLYKIQLDEEK